MIERPQPVYIKLADGTGRKMYETVPVEMYIAQQALEIDNLRRTNESLRLHILGPH